jgi:hypothetical protein
VRIQNSQLLAAKVSGPEFWEIRGNSADISKGLFQLGMCEFDPSQVSQPFRRYARRSQKCEIGPEMRAFGAFDLVSRHPNWQLDSPNWRKSPAIPENIPVLQRLLAETGFDHQCRLPAGVDFVGFSALRVRIGRLPGDDVSSASHKRSRLDQIRNVKPRTAARPGHFIPAGSPISIASIGNALEGRISELHSDDDLALSFTVPYRNNIQRPRARFR